MARPHLHGTILPASEELSAGSMPVALVDLGVVVREFLH